MRLLTAVSLLLTAVSLPPVGSQEMREAATAEADRVRREKEARGEARFTGQLDWLAWLASRGGCLGLAAYVYGEFVPLQKLGYSAAVCLLYLFGQLFAGLPMYLAAKKRAKKRPDRALEPRHRPRPVRRDAVISIIVLPSAAAPQLQREKQFGSGIAVGETVILLHSPLTLVSVSIVMERGRQQNDSLANG